MGGEVIIWKLGVVCCPQNSDIVSQAIVYGGILRDFVSLASAADRGLTCFLPPNDSMLYHYFTWLANSCSCSIFPLKHVEV